MPSRWVSSYQDLVFRFRHNPAAIAAAAGGIGLICGALVVALNSSPSPPLPRTAAKPPAETTGSASPTQTPIPVRTAEAPAKSDTASGCDQQTWPYITQHCLTERDAGQRKVRVITTDRIAPPVVSAIETEREPPRAKPAPVQAEQPAPAAAVTPPAVAGNVVQPEARTPVAPVVNLSTLPEIPKMTMAAPEPTPATAANEKPQKAVASPARTKQARELRNQRVQEAKSRRAPAQDGDDAADESPRTSSQARVVERWTEREYDVPSESGALRRRVTVRSGDSHSAGPFGALFGFAFR